MSEQQRNGEIISLSLDRESVHILRELASRSDGNRSSAARQLLHVAGPVLIRQLDATGKALATQQANARE